MSGGTPERLQPYSQLRFKCLSQVVFQIELTGNAIIYASRKEKRLEILVFECWPFEIGQEMVLCTVILESVVS